MNKEELQKTNFKSASKPFVTAKKDLVGKTRSFFNEIHPCGCVKYAFGK